MIHQRNSGFLSTLAQIGEIRTLRRWNSLLFHGKSRRSTMKEADQKSRVMTSASSRRKNAAEIRGWTFFQPSYGVRGPIHLVVLGQADQSQGFGIQRRQIRVDLHAQSRPIHQKHILPADDRAGLKREENLGAHVAVIAHIRVDEVEVHGKLLKDLQAHIPALETAVIVKMFVVERQNAEQILQAERVEVLLVGLVLGEIDAEIGFLPGPGHLGTIQRVLAGKVVRNGVLVEIHDVIGGPGSSRQPVSGRPGYVPYFAIVKPFEERILCVADNHLRVAETGQAIDQMFHQLRIRNRNRILEEHGEIGLDDDEKLRLGLLALLPGGFQQTVKAGLLQGGVE